MSARVEFIGGSVGAWTIVGQSAVRGENLPQAQRLSIVERGASHGDPSSAWRLASVRSNLRYATRAEVGALVATQPPLGRVEATHAALIPIRKSAAWWALAQDERRALFEETSHHTRIGLDYLPAIARQLHHSRDLGEPFDFITWFEFAPTDEPAFDELLARLRGTEEWRYVEREIDIRLTR